MTSSSITASSISPTTSTHLPTSTFTSNTISSTIAEVDIIEDEVSVMKDEVEGLDIAETEEEVASVDYLDFHLKHNFLYHVSFYPHLHYPWLVKAGFRDSISNQG
jgi:hypothetical protein